MQPKPKDLSLTKNSYSKINLFIRSCIFFCYSLSTIILYSLVCVLTFFLPLPTRHAIIRFYIVIYMKMLQWICHINYKIIGLENLAQVKNGVVMSKHQSTWETFFLPLIFKNPAVILKRELLWLPFFGWALAVSQPISINRGKKNSAMQQIITKGTRYLEAGRWVIVFPEGTRTAHGAIGHYKLGGARLAAASGYPIIPVAHNAGRFWPRKGFIKRPGTITVVIGPAIESKGRTPEDILHLTKTWIEEKMQEIG